MFVIQIEPMLKLKAHTSIIKTLYTFIGVHKPGDEPVFLPFILFT